MGISSSRSTAARSPEPKARLRFRWWRCSASMEIASPAAGVSPDDRSPSPPHADLRLSNVDEILDAHEEAGRGLFRGIRDALARAEPSDGLMISGGAPVGLFEDPTFRAGVARLGARGLTYDSWHYHYQNQEFF